LVIEIECNNIHGERIKITKSLNAELLCRIERGSPAVMILCLVVAQVLLHKQPLLVLLRYRLSCYVRFAYIRFRRQNTNLAYVNSDYYSHLESSTRSENTRFVEDVMYFNYIYFTSIF
jgi:hypothetical protein